MNKISLNGDWEIKHTAPEVGEKMGLQKGGFETYNWVPAIVPGFVHSDLKRNEEIGDINEHFNAEKYHWMEDKVWWYRKVFTLDSLNEELEPFIYFEGLDTYASIYINGKLLAQTDNMFRSYKFSLNELVHKGENVIVVKFDPYDEVNKRIPFKTLPGCFNVERLNYRKMQCSFGWDWGPRTASFGIWRNVEIILEKGALDGPYLQSEPVSNGRADFHFETDYKCYSDGVESVDLFIELKGREVYRESLKTSDSEGKIECDFSLDDIQLWWPNGMGDQVIYDVRVVLRSADEIFDKKIFTHGVKKIELITRENGQDVYKFRINNRNIYIRGANWVPADSFVTEISEDHYENLISRASDAHYNMLRVWGGGIYEPDIFYELCDRYGLLVWQDFMYTCGEYPQHDSFLKGIRLEGEYVVKKLRNSPSLAMWCGNNEINMDGNIKTQYSGRVIFEEILKDLCGEMNGQIPYVPSSPYSFSDSKDLIFNDPSTGDYHWGAWWDYLDTEENSDIRDLICKQDTLFTSEFYAEGAPSLTSMERFMDDFGKWPVAKEEWEYRTKDNTCAKAEHTLYERTDIYATRLFGESQSYGEYVYKLGILQSYLFQQEIEHYRRRRNKNSGVLFWMYNDIWPSVSWSVIDYYGRPKSSHYGVKRSFSPILASFEKISSRSAQLYITNDSGRDIDAELLVRKIEINGKILEEKRISVSVKQDRAEAFETFIASADQLFNSLLHVQVIVSGERVSDNHYIFADQPKLLAHSDREKINYNVKKLSGGDWEMTFSAEMYIQSVEIVLPDSSYCSDNFFSLFPHCERVVKIENKKEITEADLKIRLRHREI
ncbi:MAG: hypothetical protein B6241_12705 [Spirochaetaceae bacterium 4572_59]|nr:MAG: hypothetical protein B6241_12705 [Spirochaetaceae bacterium 4572_59]